MENLNEEIVNKVKNILLRYILFWGLNSFYYVLETSLFNQYFSSFFFSAFVHHNISYYELLSSKNMK